MANRNLQVNLSFKADTSAALKNLETLRSSLNSISSMPFQGGKVITADIRQAAAAAEQLQHHLGMAMDVKTGNLNLNKLQASLASSNTSLASLTGNLLKAGTTGQQAFLATHRAISNANLQLTKSNTLLSQFTTTLLSAAKWQAAYGAINMVTQSMGKAVDYAKELDKSLNNISIVTGYSAEKMAAFAKQANESAKALNTTTTKYTDASLIYFQQGLGDKEVKERTDITVKLANVVGESAEQVSEWTTAIWNNFAKGGESLESYADKLAALGAATASSADEIAQGLEKFSAVADTVGLSYDYATAALATVTAETRQSADVVGTAFKTLFARMEGLKLGETLDDGTTLNQYSQALMSVGINIKESNGNLKEMDTILDEMGSKWQDLGKDQQVALAQSVGGIRQYNQLIALMDNWDKFQENLTIARAAEGTLSTQAEIYAESWQAAQDNIKASMEGMYNTLIPKDFIIDFTNGLADVVDGFNKVLDAAGGLPTILLAISSIVMSKLQPQMTAMFNNIIGGFSKAGTIINGMFTDFRGTVKNIAAAQFGGRAVKTSQAMANRTDMQKEVMSSTQNALNMPGISESFKTQLIYQQEIEKHSMNLANIQGKISAAEHSRIQASIKELEALQDQTVELTRQKEKADEILATKMKSSKIMRKGVDDEYIPMSYGSTGAIKTVGLGRQTVTAQVRTSTNRQETHVGAAIRDLLENVAGAKRGSAQTGLTAEENAKLTQVTQSRQEAHRKLKDRSLTAQKRTEAEEAFAVATTREQQLRQQMLHGVSAEFEDVDSAKQGAQALVQHGSNLIRITNELKLNAQDLLSAIQPLDQEIEEIKNRAMKENRDLSTEEQKRIKSLEEEKQTKILSTQEKADKIIKDGGLTETEQKDYKKINEELGTRKDLIEGTTKSIENYGKIEEKNVKITRAAAEAVGVQGENFDEVVDGAKKSAKAAADLHGNQQQVEHSSKKVSDNFERLKESMSTVGAGLGQMTQGAAQATMGFNMIISSIQQMKEEGTLTLSGISSMLMGITMGVPGFISVLSGLKTILDANRFSILANAAALTEENQAQIANTIAKTFGITTEKALTVAKQIQEASTKKLTKAKLADILANNGLSLSNVGLAITTWMVNAPALVLMATLISLIAVVALLVVGIKALVNWYNQDAIAAEKAAKNAEILGQKYEKTKQAYEDLKTSIENIGSAQDTINSMIEGTEAWEKAVQDLNFQILELIKEYPELIKYVDRIGGRLSIDKNGLEDFQEEQYDIMLKEFNTKTVADYSSKFMAGNENQTTLSRSFVKYDVKSAALSTGLLSLMNPFMTSIGLIKEFISEKQSEDSLVLAISALEKDMEEAKGALFDSSYKFEDWVTEYSGGNETVKAVLLKHEESILENVQSQVENTLALQELSATLLKNANEGNKFYDNSKYQEYIDSYYGKGAGKEEIEARVKEKYSEMSDEELAIEYAKMLYGENSRIKHTGGDSFTIEYYDEESKSWKQHNDKKNSVDYSDLFNILVKDGLVNYQYTQEDVEKIEEKAKIIENQIKFIEDDIIRKTIGSQLISDNKELDLSNLSKEQLKEIEKDLASISDETIRNKVSAGITAALKQQSEIVKEKNEEWAKKTAKQITTDSIQDLLSDTELDKKYFDLYDKLLWKSEETTDAQKLASAENLRGAQAMKKLVKAYEENEEAFSEPSNIEEYTEALLSLQEGLKLLFNTDEDIDSGFIVQHFDLIQKAINGDIQSLEELRYLMSLSQVETLELDEDLEIIIKNALEKIYNGSYKLGDNVIDALGQSTVNAIRSAVSQAKISAAELANIFQNVNLSLVGGGQRNIDFNASSFFNYKPTYKKAELSDSKKDKKKLEDEKERYHEITKSIESQTRELDRLSKAKDRAWGSQRLSLMDAERNALEKELELQKQLLKETESYYEADKKKMASWGAKFDDNGNISNYDELMSHYVNQYNANLDSESVAEKYEDFKDDLSQYEETLEKLEDQQQVIIDKQNEIIDLALEKVQYKVEYQIEIDESEIEILEYFIEKAESGGIDKAADKIAKLTQKTGIYKDQMDLYAQAVREVFEISEYDVDALFAAAANGGQGLAQLLQGGTLTEEQIHALQEYQSSLIETNQALDEMASTINETIVSALGEMNEKFEDYLNKLEHLQSLSESYNNIVDIIGKDTLGISNAALRQMSQAQMENANGALSISKDQLEAAEQAYEQVKALYEQDPEMFRDAMKEAEASLQEAQSNFMERWETALTAAADAFKANVELIAEEFSSSVSGIYDSIEEMQGAFERQKEIGELYFQNYKKTYEISKLNRKISQDIEKSDNVKAKGELNKLAAEINTFNKDNKKMSEYDLGYLQKKYELLQAQFALEDAQNAKNQMTLRQDSEGNWGYVYTANQDDIDQRQQNYEDKLYEVEDFMYQSEQSLTEMYIQALADYEDGIQELAEKYGKGSKKFQQEALKLQKHFTTLTGYSIEEIQKLTINGSKLNEEYGTEVIDTYSNTILGQMNSSYQTFEQLQSSISQNIIRTTQKVTEAHRILSENIELVMNEAGTSIEDFKDKYEEMYNSVSNETEVLKDEVSGPDGLKEKVCQAFSDMMIEINKWYDSYGARIPQLQKQNTDIITSIQGIITKYGELDTKIQDSVSKAEEAAKKMQQLVDTDTDDGDTTGNGDNLKNITTGNVTYTIVGASGNELTVKDSSGKTHILKTNNVIRGLPQKRDGYTYADLNELFSLASPFTTNSDNTNNVDNNNSKKTSSYSLKNIKDPPRGGYTLTEGYYDDGKKMGLKGYDYRTSGDDIEELRKLSIIGYRKHPDGDIMYRLNKGVALGPQGLVFYWLNQTTLHSLLGISGQTALYKQINLVAYDTGGYTGEWGPEGRLAMLHQKEIVLNASDTENLLRTIDIVRSFNDRIEQSARMTALGLSNIGGITSRISGGDTLQQEVTIHAEFPNVTDHNEIELALGNLVNDASQYANRK